MQPLDLIISLLVLIFFLGSALVSGGDILRSLQGGLLIMLVMFTVGGSIEVIIEALRGIRGLGTVVGFITNGPEALCLLVGLLSDDIYFAASTPLGSNFMNPVMLISAALVSGTLAVVWRFQRRMTWSTLILTAILAGLFFIVPVKFMPLWVAVTLAVSCFLFYKRSRDLDDEDSEAGAVPRWAVIPAGMLLLVAGFFLDPVVDFTAEASRAPKGLIGFVVLASLTSWPEFRSCLGLLQRGRTSAAVLNITVSNITNLWLALIGIAIYLVMKGSG